ILEEKGLTIDTMVGFEKGRWIVIDTGGYVLCHIFHEDERRHYHLERLWGDASSVLLPLRQECSFITYNSFPSLYYHLLKDATYYQWINYTLQAIENHEQEVQKIIDLGCGTGEIAVRLAKQGFQVSGVDYSQEMLAYAEQKSFTYALPVQWFQQDLRMLA